MKLLIPLLIFMLLCSVSDINRDMHFLEVVAPDTPPRRITEAYWRWLPHDYYNDSEYYGNKWRSEEYDDFIAYMDKHHYAIVFERYLYQLDYDPTYEQKDIWYYGRVINRD